MQAASQAVSGGLGILFAKENDRRQLKQQGKLLEQQIPFDKELMKYNQDLQYDMWNKTNYEAQKEHMKKAGLNPGLMYGMSGGGGVTTGSGGPTAHANAAPVGGGEILGMMQLRAQQAEIELLRAQTEKTKTEKDKIAGADTDNINADTENKILESVILKYAGAEAKSYFENVKEPNRSQEMKTMSDELGARQATANTLYDLWVAGKLEESALYDIEQKEVSIAKTREERKMIEKQFDLLAEQIKSGKLENAIKEIELQLQKDTGIDRSAPTWAKVIGRIFGKYINALMKGL